MPCATASTSITSHPRGRRSIIVVGDDDRVPRPAAARAARSRRRAGTRPGRRVGPRSRGRPGRGDPAAPLAQVDAETYERALAVRDDHAELDEERRDWEIGRAFAAAAEPPLQIARVAADIAELAQEVASRADQRLRPDALAAAALASAVARACAELVAVNLTATEDDPRVREAHSHAEAAQRAAATAFAA